MLTLCTLVSRGNKLIAKAGFSVRKMHFALIFFMSEANNKKPKMTNKTMQLSPCSQFEICLKIQD